MQSAPSFFVHFCKHYATEFYQWCKSCFQVNLLSGIDLFFSPKEFFDLNRFSHPLKHSFEIATKSEDESKVFCWMVRMCGTNWSYTAMQYNRSFLRNPFLAIKFPLPCAYIFSRTYSNYGFFKRWPQNAIKCTYRTAQEAISPLSNFLEDNFSPKNVSLKSLPRLFEDFKHIFQILPV